MQEIRLEILDAMRNEYLQYIKSLPASLLKSKISSLVKTEPPVNIRRITLRKDSIATSHRQIEPLLNSSLVMPLAGGMVLDLEAGVTRTEIENQVGLENMNALKQKLLDFKLQTEALLAQFE